jgi:hypothetical protein
LIVWFSLHQKGRRLLSSLLAFSKKIGLNVLQIEHLMIIHLLAKKENGEKKGHATKINSHA